MKESNESYIQVVYYFVRKIDTVVEIYVVIKSDFTLHIVSLAIFSLLVLRMLALLNMSEEGRYGKVNATTGRVFLFYLIIYPERLIGDIVLWFELKTVLQSIQLFNHFTLGNFTE